MSGEPFEEQMTYRRAEPTEAVTGTSGGRAAGGLAGTWKGEDFTSQSPGHVEFRASGPDTLAIRVPAWGTETTVKMDGKDYSLTGPRMPPGFTVSMTKAGPGSWEVAYKQDGKPTGTSTWTVSPDGQTLTMVDRVPGQEGSVKAVFDRQQ